MPKDTSKITTIRLEDIDEQNLEAIQDYYRCSQNTAVLIALSQEARRLPKDIKPTLSTDWVAEQS